MKPTYKVYSFEESLREMDLILDGDVTTVTEQNALPDDSENIVQKSLYAYCSVIYVDIRVMQDWMDANKRILYAKFYRSLVTQVCSLFESTKLCQDINSSDSAIWGIFDTRYKNDINELITLVAQLNSLLKTLNFKMSKRQWPTFRWGIGVCYDRILLFDVKGESDTISRAFFGPVLKNATRLASYGNKTYFDSPIMISEIFYSNLNDDNKKLFRNNAEHDCYHGNIINVEMDEWYKKNNV